MDKLSEVYGTLDRLNHEELAQVRAYIDQRMMQPQISDEDPHRRAAALMAALAEIREGLSKEELDEMIEAMNSEYIEPLDPADYAWLDDDEGETD
jgi:uncharacterized protein YeeX (DUF496 family)